MTAIKTLIYIGLPDVTELLGNPGFETLGAGGNDVFDTWSEGGPDWPIAEQVLVHSGNYACKLPIGAGATQCVAVTPGNMYRFSFWTRGDGTNCGRWYLWDATHAEFIYSRQDTFIQGTVYKWWYIDVEAPAGCFAICPAVSDPQLAGVAYFDDVSFIDITPIWTLNTDVLRDPTPVWEYGIDGHGPRDLVASTGFLNFSLDNGLSNSQGLAGLYSPGHANCLAGFDEGAPVKVEVTAPQPLTSKVKFVGKLSGVHPASGLYDEDVVEVEAHDWIGLLADEETGFLDIATNKRADEALTLALVNMSVQPEDTDFDNSIETFPVVFHKESIRTSMATLLQRLARNEQGRIYCEGDGTLVFESRYARPMVTSSSFTLDGIMTNFDVGYVRRDIFNVIRAQIILHKVDAAATTVLWELQLYPLIRAGEELVIECPYRDPDTGWYASGLEIVDPITQIKFGSVGDGANDDYKAYLVWSQDVGSNVSEVTLTNNHSVDGYLNQLKIIGKGLYTYDPLIIEIRDEISIALRGERVDMIRLEYIDEISTGRAYATYLKGQQSSPHLRAQSISFLANQSEALALAALAAEPGTRFTAVEEATGVDCDFFINRLKYRQRGPNLWLDVLAIPVPIPGTFIWDSSHWDDEDDARWAI